MNTTKKDGDVGEIYEMDEQEVQTNSTMKTQKPQGTQTLYLGSNKFLQALMGAISVSLNHKLFKEGALLINVPSPAQKAQLEKYHEYLYTIDYALKRIQNYKKYFEDLYSEKINHSETLEYHIQNFLQDQILFRNKVDNMLGALINDFQKSGDRKLCKKSKELKIIRKSFLGTFEDVKKNRDPHHHRGIQFIDPDVNRSQGIANLKELSKTGRIKIDEEYAQAEADKSLLMAKVKSIQDAKEISVQVDHNLTGILVFIYEDLLKLLDINELVKNLFDPLEK